MNIIIYSILWLFTTEPSMAKPLSCPETIMINKSKEEWNKYDKEMLEYAKRRCGALYPAAPCCKQFIKNKKQDYGVVCGKQNG